MQVILKKDVQNLGYKDQIVKVKDGYANNYLIPQGYAIIATESAKKVLAENIKQQAVKEAKIIKEAENTKATLESKVVRIVAKVGENGQLFGGVNNMLVAEALQAQHGIEVDRKAIVVDGSKIKEVGSYKAIVNIHKEIKAELNIEVIAE